MKSPEKVRTLAEADRKRRGMTLEEWKKKEELSSGLWARQEELKMLIESGGEPKHRVEELKLWISEAEAAGVVYDRWWDVTLVEDAPADVTPPEASWAAWSEEEKLAYARKR